MRTIFGKTRSNMDNFSQKLRIELTESINKSINQTQTCFDMWRFVLNTWNFTRADYKCWWIMYRQQDLTWQEIWRTYIHLFKVRWNDYLVNYFLLMYRYGINKNILNLTFSRAELWLFRRKCQSLQEYLMKK